MSDISQWVQLHCYLVPMMSRAAHDELVEQLRRVMERLGCQRFETYAQPEPSLGNSTDSCRYVQMIYFRDRAHFAAVREAERRDGQAQFLLGEFCRVIDLPAQRRAGSFESRLYQSARTSRAGNPPVLRRSQAAGAQPRSSPAVPSSSHGALAIAT